MRRRLLTGTYECSLDNRFRLAIPARVREPFQEGGAVIGWWLDDCVIVVPAEDWGGLIERTFPEMNPLDDRKRDLSRFLLAGAFDQELDKQGRISLPQHLRDHAGIGQRATVVGVGEYLEVWDPDRLASRFATLREEGVSARANSIVANATASA